MKVTVELKGKVLEKTIDIDKRYGMHVKLLVLHKSKEWRSGRKVTLNCETEFLAYGENYKELKDKYIKGSFISLIARQHSFRIKNEIKNKYYIKEIDIKSI